MSRALRGLLVLLAIPVLTTCGDSTGPEHVTSDWEGRIDRGDAVEIKGVNGRIEALPTAGEIVKVTTAKRGFDDDPALVIIQVLTHGNGVTICAVYPSPAGDPPNECRPELGGRMNVRGNDVEVDFTVLVPEGVDFVARNVNGPIHADGLLGSAFVYNVNGDVTVSTSELGEAATVNGSVWGALSVVQWARELTFSTVNGDVTVQLPSDVNADVTCSTVNGTLFSEFGTTKTGPATSFEKLGSGGGHLIMSTVNGDVRLERSG